MGCNGMRVGGGRRETGDVSHSGCPPTRADWISTEDKEEAEAYMATCQLWRARNLPLTTHVPYIS